MDIAFPRLFFGLLISDIDTIAEGRDVDFVDDEGNKKRYLYQTFRDDLFLFCGGPEELKNAMISLEDYCIAKELIINFTLT